MKLDIVHKISIPNPFFEGRNSVYVLKTDPVTLIDSGVATSIAFDALRHELKAIGIRIRDIQQVILTHKHIDHIGNAWRIQQESDAKIFIHESEIDAVADIDPDGSRFSKLVERRLDEWKAPKLVQSNASPPKMPRWELKSAVALGLKDGQTISLDAGKLSVIHTPGHTMGSICLQYEDQLLSGDHVLEKLSPNIGAGDMRRSGMLKKYLESLDRVTQLERISIVLPGHGEPFQGLAQRCNELACHHRERMEKILMILDHGTKTVFEVAVELFGDMQDFHMMLGCAEANAHLELLQEQGLVQKSDSQWNSVR